ncbi:MAG: anti-sigma factor [Actinomycetota bacterium]|nr:anti-sigma factor [Actinomycetota bacterium]
MSHTAAGELLGVYALDALDPDERDAVDAHAAECGACQAEITRHREVAAFLAPVWTPAPEGLWNRIVEGLEETPPPLDMPLAPAPVAPVAPVVPIDRRSRRSRPMAAVAAMVAVAAVAVVGVLGFKVIDDGRRIDNMNQQALGTEFDRTVNAALADPSGRHVNLQNADGAVRAQAVMLPDGAGFITNKSLAELPSNRTYQLWALVGTSRISVGVLGPKVASAGFRAPTSATGFALTEENAGGVVASANNPVVVGKY